MHAHFLHSVNTQLISEKVTFLNYCSISPKTTSLRQLSFSIAMKITCYTFTTCMATRTCNNSEPLQNCTEILKNKVELLIFKALRHTVSRGVLILLSGQVFSLTFTSKLA